MYWASCPYVQCRHPTIPLRVTNVIAVATTEADEPSDFLKIMGISPPPNRHHKEPTGVILVSFDHLMSGYGHECDRYVVHQCISTEGPVE